MKTYEIKFFCDRCDQEIKLQLNSEAEIEVSDIERFQKELQGRHNHEEHTYCTNCKKKINPKEAKIEIIGRQDPNTEEARKGVAMTLLFGHFCPECYEEIKKAKKGNK